MPTTTFRGIRLAGGSETRSYVDLMGLNSDFHSRRSPRLEGYDYSLNGAYFVTICAHNHASLFGEILNGEMRLNNLGEIVKTSLLDLPCHYRHIDLDTFSIMPNHIHVLISFPGVGAGLRPARNAKEMPQGLPEIIRALKSFSSRGINQICKTPGNQVWQRGYYEHIVRKEDDLNRIREYIEYNPARWAEDEENLSMQ